MVFDSRKIIFKIKKRKNGARTSGPKLHAKGGHATKKLKEWVQGKNTLGLKTGTIVMYPFKIMREESYPKLLGISNNCQLSLTWALIKDFPIPP